MATKNTTRPAQRRRERGMSAVEALVAAAILALGMIGLARLHATLRAHADAARERSEAVRLAQQEIEQLRAFASVAAWSAIADAEPADVTPAGSTTHYVRERIVRTDADAGLKSVLVVLRWTDRQGAAQQLRLQTRIAGTDPALAGALALPRPDL